MAHVSRPFSPMSFSIVHNDCILESSSQSPVDFLRRRPPGPYTSLIARGDGRVLAWDAHIHRLATALRKLDSCIPPINAKTWNLQLSIDDTCEELQKQLLPKLRVAFNDDKRQKSGLPDLSIVALLGTEIGTAPVLLHTTPCIWPTASLGTHVKAKLFEGGPRRLAAVKHSQWVTDRRPFETDLTPGSEGVLCGQTGELLEGLVSNIFIVRSDGVVQTAHPLKDKVLDGIMRATVVHTLHSLSIPLIEKAPNLADSKTWQEAFSTNCRNMIQPISSMSFSQTTAAYKDWQCQLACPGPVTTQLHKAVLQSCSGAPLLEQCKLVCRVDR